MNSLYIPLFFARLGLALRILSYEPLREYAGKDFFSGWGINGSSTSTIQHSGTQHNLTFVNHSNGHAIIRVDNTTKFDSVHHNSRSIKITTTDTYSTGNLILIDAVHVPRFGRSVQPSFSLGELDLMGGIQNQFDMAQWQTDYVQQPEPQSPKTLKGSTASDRCREPIEREAGERDGGMFALQIDVERVSMWFWSRQYIPFSISQAKFREGMNVDISDWRRPSAVYPAVGHGQKLALGVTLCGDQAGEPEVHTETCLDPGVGESQCHHGPNSFTSAYWEISYIRTFTLHAVRRKPRLFARAESGTSTTSSIDLLPSIHLSIKINPPHPTLFKPTTVATTATSHSDGQVVAETGTASTITIFNPTSTEDPRFTRTWVKATVVIFQPTTGSVFVATVAATSTPEAGDNETDTVSDIAATPTSSQSTATVVDITVGGSVKSITLTVPGVGVVGATTRLGASGPTFSQTDATLPSGSSSNPGSLTGISVDVVDITVGGSVESITLTVPGVGVVGATTSNSVGLGASSQTDATLPSGSAVSSNAGSLTRISVDLLVAGLVLSIFAEIHIT